MVVYVCMGVGAGMRVGMGVSVGVGMAMARVYDAWRVCMHIEWVFYIRLVSHSTGSITTSSHRSII